MNHRVFIIFCLFTFTGPVFSQQSWLAQIESALQNNLGEKIEQMAKSMNLAKYNYKIEMNYIDPRLNLAVCNKPISIEQPNPLELGRSHIKVACDGQVKWALNVPVDIALNTQVVVSTRPLERNVVLKADMLSYQVQNLAELNNGYYLLTKHLVGKQLKRAISGHTAFNSHLVKAGMMIFKGDTVMITAKKAGMQVNMPGEALSDGRKGRQIRVRNKKSDRIITGKVVGPGLVEVNF